MKNTDTKIIKPRNVSGLANYTEAENFALAKWIRSLEETYELYGYSKLIPRPLELREILLSKGGIEKQIFGVSRLVTNNPTKLALPFDRTMPLANWVAQNQSRLNFPFKRYDISYSFRGERAQNGRFNAFFQADIDIIQREELNISVDAECIATIYEAVRSLNIGLPYICLNNLPLVRAIIDTFQYSENTTLSLLSILDDIKKVDEEESILRLLSLKEIKKADAQKMYSIFSFQGNIDSFLSETNCPLNKNIETLLEETKNVFRILNTISGEQATYIFAPYIVRGLNYYTGIVFETFLEGYENFGSIASGGRYDNLIDSFSKENFRGFGGSIGLTRLFDLVCKNNLLQLQQKTNTDVLICFKNDDNNTRDSAYQIAKKLRQMAISTDLYNGNKSVTDQLKYANNKGIEKVIILFDSDTMVIKDMMSGEQQEFKQQESFLQYITDAFK